MGSEMCIRDSLMANTYKNVKADLTSTGLVVLLNVPTGSTCILKSILVSEDAGSGTTITVTLVNSSGTIFSLFKTKTISGNTKIWNRYKNNFIIVPINSFKFRS